MWRFFGQDANQGRQKEKAPEGAFPSDFPTRRSAHVGRQGSGG